LAPLALPPDLPPVILMDLICLKGVVVVVVLKVMDAEDR